MISTEDTVNFTDLPARKLTESCRRLISNALNITVIRTAGKIQRDYRGLALLMGVVPEEVLKLESSNDPTEELLNIWMADPTHTVEMLIEMLNTMTRFDVVEELLDRLNTTTEANNKQIKNRIKIVTREEWGGYPLSTDNLVHLKLPVQLVVIHHTKFSSTGKSMLEVVNDIQNYSLHLTGDPEELEHNFVVTSDGTILELTGWSVSSFHHCKFDFMAVQIALTGDYDTDIPSDRMLESLHHLLQLGVAEGKLSTDFKLSGYCDVDPSSSPGKNVMNVIKQWPNYSKSESLLNQPEDGHLLSFDFT